MMRRVIVIGSQRESGWCEADTDITDEEHL